MFALRRCALAASLSLAAAALPAAAAELTDLPARKDGCWEHTLAQGPAGKSPLDGGTYECVNAASEQERLQLGQQPEAGACRRAKVDISRADVASLTTCNDGGVVTTYRFEASGDFQSDYAMTILSKTARRGKPAQISRVRAKARWVSGVCPVGLNPGGWLLVGGAACGTDAVSN